jgi:hypothetical protein
MRSDRAVMADVSSFAMSKWYFSREKPIWDCIKLSKCKADEPKGRRKDERALETGELGDLAEVEIGPGAWRI